MLYCKDCYGEFESDPQYDNDGNPLSADCLINACDSCQKIRMGLGVCWICGGELDKNRLEKRDTACESCSDKWDRLPEVEIACQDCGTYLQQDPENLYELWCPKCLDKKAVFVKQD